jgi:hypothetical protein
MLTSILTNRASIKSAVTKADSQINKILNAKS